MKSILYDVITATKLTRSFASFCYFVSWFCTRGGQNFSLTDDIEFQKFIALSVSNRWLECYFKLRAGFLIQSQKDWGCNASFDKVCYIVADIGRSETFKKNRESAWEACNFLCLIFDFLFFFLLGDGLREKLTKGVRVLRDVRSWVINWPTCSSDKSGNIVREQSNIHRLLSS